MHALRSKNCKLTRLYIREWILKGSELKTTTSKESSHVAEKWNIKIHIVQTGFRKVAITSKWIILLIDCISYVGHMTKNLLI
jgi:hypothetical protein